MKNKIINYLRTSRLITESMFIYSIIIFELTATCYSLYLQKNHILYYQNPLDNALTIITTLLSAYIIYLPKSMFQLQSEYVLFFELISFAFIHYYIYKLYKFLFPLSKIQMQNLIDLNYAHQQETIKKNENGTNRIIKTLYYPYFIINDYTIQLGSYNLKKTEEEVTSELEKLSAIFNYNLVEVTKKEVKGNQVVFTLTKDVFSRIEVENSAPKHYSILVGKNMSNESIVLDLRKQFSLFIGGTSGSGKTILILNYIKQLYDSVNGDLDIIIIDDKGVDYKDLVTNYKATYYDSSSLEDLEAFNSRLENILEQKNQTKKILAENRVEHAEDLRLQNIELPLRRTVILGDEAGAYLRAKTETRKDFKEVKKKIISNMTIAISQLRAFGCPIIVATQRVTKDEIDVPYDNFQVRLFNGIAKEMSSKYCNGLVGDKATRGKWFISSEIFNGFIKTPYDPNIKSNFSYINSKKDNVGTGVNEVNVPQHEIIVEEQIIEKKRDSILEIEQAVCKTERSVEKKKSPMAHFYNKKKVS